MNFKGAGKTYSYKIDSDGVLIDQRLFADRTSDGLTVDRYGNVYLTMKNVSIYTPSGKLIKVIEVPGSTTNVCFGGKNNRTLFITNRSSLYSIK